MNKLIIKNIFKEYEVIDVVQSFMTALLFFTIISAMILLPAIQMIHLYVPYLEYFLAGIYIAMSLNSLYFSKLFVETLQNYKIIETIDYDTFKVRMSTIMTAIIFIIVLVAFIVIQ